MSDTNKTYEDFNSYNFWNTYNKWISILDMYSHGDKVLNEFY